MKILRHTKNKTCTKPKSVSKQVSLQRNMHITKISNYIKMKGLIKQYTKAHIPTPPPLQQYGKSTA